MPPTTEICRLFIDMRPGDEAPRPGHYVLTVGKNARLNSAYLIWKVRRSRRPRPDGGARFHLVCFRATIDDARKVHPSHVWAMRWYPRKRKAA